MKHEILVSFVTALFLLGFTSAAYGEVPCEDGYIYSCNSYGICGCKKPSTSGLDVVVAAATTEGDVDGNDLLIWNNGDGSDFSRGGAGNDTLLGGRGNDVVEIESHVLIELGLAAGLSEKEIALLLPAVQQ